MSPLRIGFKLINDQYIIKRLNFQNHIVFAQLLIESDAIDIAM